MMTRDKKGRFRKFMDSVDEELNTLKKVRNIFINLHFVSSHVWVILWLSQLYDYDLRKMKEEKLQKK